MFSISCVRVCVCVCVFVCLLTQSPGHAVNALFYGRKRWFLFPPANAFFKLLTVREWIDNDYPTLVSQGCNSSSFSLSRVCVCVCVCVCVFALVCCSFAWLSCTRPTGLQPIEVMQEGGDVVFVPEGWGHAVLNLEDTLAVAIEFHEV
jgi:hypothetical protein